MNILLAYVWSPYTTAAYYAKAFRDLGHKVRTVGPVNQSATARVPEGQRYRLTGGHDMPFVAVDWQPDLLMWIEAGGDWVPTPCFHHGGAPVVAYFIDSHSRLEQHKAVAEQFTHRFCAQRQYADALDATWLPVACDPDVHTPTRTEPPEYDVAFVGNTYGDAPIYAKRRDVLAALAGRYKCNFQSGVYFEDMANVYASARVAFNVSTNGDLNMRVFEAMCSGRPLVTDEVPGTDLFEDMANLYTWAAPIDAMSTIDYLLACPEIAGATGAAGCAKVLARHTYKHRAAQMLEAVGL